MARLFLPNSKENILKLNISDVFVVIGIFPLYNIRLVSWPFLKNTLISRKKKSWILAQEKSIFITKHQRILPKT